MKTYIISAAILFTFCVPLIAAESNAITPEEELFQQKVIDTISEENPVIIEHGMQDHTDYQTEGKTITPKQIEKYKDDIVHRVEWFYGIILTLLLVFLSFGTLFLELFRGNRFKSLLDQTRTNLREHTDREIADAEKKLQQHTEDKIADAEKKLTEQQDKALKKIHTSLATSFGVAAFTLKSLDNINGAAFNGILAIQEYLSAGNFNGAKKLLSFTCPELRKVGKDGLSKEHWSSIEAAMHTIKECYDLSNHPDISDLVDEIGRLASYNIVLLNKDEPESKP